MELNLKDVFPKAMEREQPEHVKKHQKKATPAWFVVTMLIFAADQAMQAAGWATLLYLYTTVIIWCWPGLTFLYAPWEKVVLTFAFCGMIYGILKGFKYGRRVLRWQEQHSTDLKQ